MTIICQMCTIPPLGRASWVHHVCPTTELVTRLLFVADRLLCSYIYLFAFVLSGLLLCMDGIPAFSFAKGVSLKPLEFKNLSLPPAQREKIDHILLLMLIPNTLKGRALKKYFDFAAKFELNDLFYNGIDGIKVKVFSTSMDTPGRAELLGNSSLIFITSPHRIIIFLLIFFIIRVAFVLYRFASRAIVPKLLCVHTHMESRSSQKMYV